MFTVGGTPGVNELCKECSSSVIAESGVLEPAETALLIDEKNVEPFAIAPSLARCWQEMGVIGSQGQFRYTDATSPTGYRVRYSWLTVHDKGTNLAMTDAHVTWTSVDGMYDNNLLKYDCMRNATDQRTWPNNTGDASNCHGYDTITCTARAKLLVAAENL
jgi:hypothetical protein